MEGRSALLSDPDAILVSAISLYEVGRYVERTSGQETLEEVLAHMSRCRVVPVDGLIAFQAIDLAAKHRLHLADALIAATAVAASAELVTFDSDLLRLEISRQP